MAEVWGDIVVTDDSLTQCVADIRKAIDDEKRRIIQTVPKKGYRLVLQETAPTVKAKSQPLTLIATVAIIVLTIFTLFGGYRLITSTELGGFTEPFMAGAAQASIIVMPFDDLSENGDRSYFADGMTEDLTTELARWRELKVIARHSALTYKGKSIDVRDVAKEMDVRYLLEGSVRKFDEKVRINAQLIDGNTGGHVWADRFDQTGSDVLKL